MAPDQIGSLLYPAYERLCAQVVHAIEEEISIGQGNAEDTRLLGLKQNDLVVFIERTAKNAAAGPLEWRLSRGEARHFRYRLPLDTAN